MAVSAAVAVVIAVVVMIVIFAAIEYYTNPSLYRLTPSTSTSTRISTPPQAYALNAATTGYDHFNPGTTYTAGTNFNTLWDAFVNGAYQEIGSNTQSISIQPNYDGTIYAVVTVPSGQNYYVDPALTQQRNSPLVTSWTYTSVANNGVNNYVFKLSNIPVTPVGSGSNSPLDFYPYFIAGATLSMNTPSGITSVGTSTNTQFVQWQGTFPSGTPSVGTEITEIQVIVNTTNAAVFTLNSVNDPATWNNQGSISAGLIQGTSFTPQQGSSTYTYTYNIAKTPTDFSSGQYLLYGTNSLDNFPFTLSGTFDFGAATTTTNCLNVNLEVYLLNAAGTISTLTEPVNVASGSAC
jgi:hypothetical protein